MKDEIKNLIPITIFVILALVGVYLVTAIFKTGEIGGKSKNTTTTSSGVTELYDDMILANNTFDKSANEYMVLFFNEKDLSESLKTIIKAYSEDKKLYKVNLDEAINKFVISDEENPNAASASELKINKTTLVTISNNKIISYITDEKEIKNTLK